MGNNVPEGLLEYLWGAASGYTGTPLYGILDLKWTKTFNNTVTSGTTKGDFGNPYSATQLPWGNATDDVWSPGSNNGVRIRFNTYNAFLTFLNDAAGYQGGLNPPIYHVFDQPGINWPMPATTYSNEVWEAYTIVNTNVNGVYMPYTDWIFVEFECCEYDDTLLSYYTYNCVYNTNVY